VPGRRKSGERRLEDAIAALGRALSEADTPWMVIGGIAVIARGVRRMTTDVDIVVRGDAIAPAKLLELLDSQDFEPRIDDALAFARKNLVLLVRHRPTGVDADIALGWSSFEHHALESRSTTQYGRARVPMVTAADLVVFKAIAGRPKDLDDAEALLLLHPDIDVARARKWVRELPALAEAEGIVSEFERIVARVRRARRAVRAPKRRRRS
jgi:hypothetical protein